MAKATDNFKDFFNNKGMSDVMLDDSYDDINCADYEVHDYDDNENENESITLDAAEQEFARDVLPDAEIKPKDEMIKIFTRIAAVVNDPDSMEYEVEDAQVEALSYMKGVIKSVISTKFKEYVRQDPSFAEDLTQSACESLIRNLGKYDGTRGIAPSTFFYIHIKSGMVAVTNLMKNCIRPSDAALRRKIKKIDKQCKECGREATIRDYIAETGESRRKIETILRVMNIKTGHLDAMDQYDSYIAGDDSKSLDYETPESAVIRKALGEEIVKRLSEICVDEDLLLFKMNTIENIDVPEIARRLGRVSEEDKIRRAIKAIATTASSDSVIKRLAAGLGYGKEPVHAINFKIIDLNSKDDNIFDFAPEEGYLVVGYV